jgi:hypothetical protein
MIRRLLRGKPKREETILRAVICLERDQEIGVEREFSLTAAAAPVQG